MKLEDYYSVKAAAQKSGIPYMALHQRIHRGSVKVVRLSETIILIHKDDVAKLSPVRKRDKLPWNPQDESRDRSHPLWPVYYRMMRACYLPKYRDYSNHGGKGRRVCDRWLKSFKQFCDDVGMPPDKNNKLVLIDGAGDYQPENCRWEATNGNPA